MPKCCRTNGLKSQSGILYPTNATISQRPESTNERSFSSDSPYFAGNCAAFIFSLAAPAVTAQGPSSTWSQDDTLRIAKEVQKRLAGLNNYGVFDWITFGFRGKAVVLKGFASRPTLKKQRSQRSQRH